MTARHYDLLFACLPLALFSVPNPRPSVCRFPLASFLPLSFSQAYTCSHPVQAEEGDTGRVSCFSIIAIRAALYCVGLSGLELS